MSKKKVVIDSSTYSNFACTNSFGLIQEMFKGNLCTSSLVIQEIRKGAKTKKALEIIFPAVSNKTVEVIDILDENALDVIASLPQKFSDCDKTLLAICEVNQWILLSDDDEMIKYCWRNNLVNLTTSDILNKAITDKLIDKNGADNLLKAMEAEANYIWPEGL